VAVEAGGGVPTSPTRPTGDKNLSGERGPQPPKWKGRETGHAVRKDGKVWEWDTRRVRWVALRDVTKRDRNVLPHASQGKDAVAPKWADKPATGPDPNKPAAEPAGGTGKPSAGGGKGEPAAGGGKANNLRGVPGGGKWWKVGDQYFLVYTAPRLGGGDPIQLAYRVRPDEVEAISGKKNPKVDRTVKDAKALDRLGIIRGGTSTQLADLGKHPWDAMREDFADEVKVRPWLRDPEMLALTVEAHLEGRAVTEAEMANTQWWQSRTPAERAWAQFVGINGGAKSPAVQQRVTDARNDVERRMIAAGLSLDGDAHERVREHLAREFVTGRLTEDALQTTIDREANPYATGATPTAGFEQLPEGAQAVRHGGRTYLRIDGKDFALAKGLETAKYGANAKKVDSINRAGVARNMIARRSGTPQGRDSVRGLEEVRGLVREWLGPQLMDGWKESEIAQWAQRIVENPQARNELVAKLRATRAARYQGYDAELTYEDIARIGRAQVLDTWGQQMDETDPLFQQILQMNDAAQASQLLWSEGLNRGVRKVTYDAMSGLDRGLGGGVVRSVV
jgi:hypothetical protein